MHRELFKFDLPESLIAKQPATERRASRLMTVQGETGKVAHRQFSEIEQLLHAGDLLVLNNTRVIPARLFAQKETGGKLEILIERMLDDNQVLAHVKASKSPKPGSRICLENDEWVTVLGREGALFKLHFDSAQSTLEILESLGHMPLPPYIDRDDTLEDRSRYQTVFAEVPGAVAAPTAGLHFDDAMLDQLRKKGVDIAYVTLHVGAGTFQPVRVDNIFDHVMHSEVAEVTEQVCEQVRQAQSRGGRVVAVGTTSVRCLESASVEGEIMPFQGETDIFIYPGYRFKTVDALLTNFHLSESTLMMLVSAFGGYQQMMSAYREAVDQQYRFFSYGDAMFITKNPQAAEDIPQ